MFTLSKTHSGQRKEGRALFRKRIWLRTLVLAGLGAMVLTVLCLLPGCGSDSTPEGSVKGKNAKTATSPQPQKMQGSNSLLVDKDETGPGKMGKIQKQPESKFVEPIPGVTQEESEASAAGDRKILESPDTEVFPGMTQAQLEVRLAADTGFDSKTAEVWPGMTQAELDARLAADTGLDPKTAEVWPGMTQAEVDVRVAAEEASFDPKTAEVFPGMTQAQLDAQNAKQEVPDNRELVPPAVGK